MYLDTIAVIGTIFLVSGLGMMTWQLAKFVEKKK